MSVLKFLGLIAGGVLLLIFASNFLEWAIYGRNSADRKKQQKEKERETREDYDEGGFWQ